LVGLFCCCIEVLRARQDFCWGYAGVLGGSQYVTKTQLLRVLLA
jgi:hypothetical protein